ncbi:hypothetical protein B566_EDAN008831 [Ephemera danica]|nr:hypothetical protein B566_EDAN008831 [Ephemera danica]
MNTTTFLFLVSCVVLAVGGKVILSDAARQKEVEERVKQASVWREKFDREVVLPSKSAAENGIATEEEQQRLLGLPNIPQLSQSEDMLLHQTFQQLKEDMETLDILTNALKKQKPGKA